MQTLVADCAGLPALARIVETTSARVQTHAVVEVPDADHRVDLPGAAKVTWVSAGNGHGPSLLEEVVRSLPLPDDAGYVWVAGESTALRGVRRHLRRELGLAPSAYKAVGYWIEKAETWRERYAALDVQTRASLEQLWTSERPEEDIELEYDDRLSELGL